MVIPEKRKLIFLLLIIQFLSQIYFGFWGFLGWPVLVFVFYLYRIKKIVPPAKPKDIISPIDGTVMSIKPTINPYLQTDSQCIVIKQPLFGALSLYSPTEGKIFERWWSGKDCGIQMPKRCFAVAWETDEGDKVIMAIQYNPWLKLLKFYAQTGERVGQAKRFGIAGHGLLVKIYVPANSKILIEPSEQVNAGVSSLVKLIS